MATPSRSRDSTPLRADLPANVALAEQFDHSILNDATDGLVDVVAVASPVLQRRKRAFPFSDMKGKGKEDDGMVTDELLEALPTQREFAPVSGSEVRH